MTNIIVHVGMTKAGSTTLQDNVFAHHSQIENIWKPNYTNLMREMVNVEDNDLAIEDVQSFLNEKIEKAKKEGKTIVASNEQMTGTSALWPAATRIKKFLPNAKIFIVIREQAALLQSFYIYQHRRLGGTFGMPERYQDLPVTFEEFLNFHLPEGKAHQNMSLKFMQMCWHLRYANTLGLYAQYFGKENVLALPLEMMQHEPDVFSQHMGKFFDIDAAEIETLLRAGRKKNTRPVQGTLAYENWRKKLPAIPFSKFIPFGSTVRKYVTASFKKHGDDGLDWPQKAKERLHTLYAQDNLMLSQQTGLDLKKYGYILPD